MMQLLMMVMMIMMCMVHGSLQVHISCLGKGCKVPATRTNVRKYLTQFQEKKTLRLYLPFVVGCPGAASSHPP